MKKLSPFCTFLTLQPLKFRMKLPSGHSRVFSHRKPCPHSTNTQWQGYYTHSIYTHTQYLHPHTVVIYTCVLALQKFRIYIQYVHSYTLIIYIYEILNIWIFVVENFRPVDSPQSESLVWGNRTYFIFCSKCISDQSGPVEAWREEWRFVEREEGGWVEEA